MRKSWLMCVLLGTLAWGQAAPSALRPRQTGQCMAPAGATADTSASVPPDAARDHGDRRVCRRSPSRQPPKARRRSPRPRPRLRQTKTPPADCKTVITKAEFEKLANAVAPNITPQSEKQLAGVLPRFIAMSSEAKKKGLDKTAAVQDRPSSSRKMQILTNELQRKIQEEAANIPPGGNRERTTRNTLTASSNSTWTGCLCRAPSRPMPSPRKKIKRRTKS